MFSQNSNIVWQLEDLKGSGFKKEVPEEVFVDQPP